MIEQHLTVRERAFLHKHLGRRYEKYRKSHIPRISMISIWPTAVPTILAVPYDGQDNTAHLRISAIQIVEAIQKAGGIPSKVESSEAGSSKEQSFSCPVPVDEWQRGTDTLKDLVQDGAWGAALMVTWNLARRWAFEHGKFCGENGIATEKQRRREPASKMGKQHGGAKPGAGRKPLRSDAEIWSAFTETSPSWKLAQRHEAAAKRLGMKAEGVRKRLIRMRRKSGQIV